MEAALKRTFAALAVRNYKLFVFGQGISLCGTWLQTVSVSWLVLKLTGSGTQLGLVVAVQFLPILLFGVWGGVVADRFDKRRVLYVTQTLAGLLALGLGLIVVLHVVQVWMVYALAAGLGLVTAVDSPTRQSFVIEMVGPEHIRNAITLNSTMVNTARVIGPTIAGVLIATVGIGACFLVNAASYIAVLIALKAMHQEDLSPAPVSKREDGQIRAGLRYVWNEPTLKSTLLMTFIIGTFAYEMPVVLPLFATITLHGDAGTFSALMVATGIGAIVSGLYTAGQTTTRETQLVWSAILFGLSLLLAAVMPSFITELLVLVAVGGLSILFFSLGNTTLQLTSTPMMRGRVMSLLSIAFLGSTPIGGPIIGFISEHLNPRVGLATGGASAILAGGMGLYIYTRGLRRTTRKA